MGFRSVSRNLDDILRQREDLILAIGITPKGSLQLASQLDIGHDATETVEDKEEQLADLSKDSEFPVLLRGSQAVQLLEMHNDINTRQEMTQRKTTTRPKQGSILSKPTGVVQDQAETQPDRMSTREEETPRA